MLEPVSYQQGTPRLFRRALPIANLAACLLFVLLREPAEPWYLHAVDRARHRGATYNVSDIWGTMACRALNNWGPIHGREAIGVMALEVVNLPSLLLTAIGGMFVEDLGVAYLITACQWSWLLAGMFMVASSAQWWYIGHRIDARGGRLAINPVWLAYAAAPWGVAPVTAGFQIAYAILYGDAVRDTLLTAAVVFAYFIGLLLLPVWWIFEAAGWRSWRYYVSTGTCAGGLTAFLFMGLTKATWDAYVIGALSGMSCAIVFSIVLRYRVRLRPAPR